MKKFFQQGFKPAKCKTDLRMANSRLKILQNKTEIQIKELRRELAQLLESGQTHTARIRVEQLVSKEKRVAAYELIGIYCELLVLRLIVIESNKNCPIDLKEAVASVLFASQRLSDVPELSEIFKQFKTKYGKDFVTSAIELRPDSGVSRLLVEKLSAKAPDGPTKVKILLEIAKEHNVVWEAKSFVEPDSRDTECLSGASSFQSASSINVDSSRVQAPASVNIHHGSSEKHHSLENSYARDGKPSSRIKNHGDVNSSWQNWETEFADSTDAARAAAEAAERASFAARAAAELSSKERMTRQDSIQSNLSSASNSQSSNYSDDNVTGSDYKDLYSKKAVNLEKRPSFRPPLPSSSDENDSDMERETEKEFRDQPSLKQKPLVVPQTVTSQDTETPSREKASHVHPKLPDYDDIFARIGALNRR